MRIAQVATLATPVRPAGHSGSIEGLVWLMTEHLTRMGHEVTVFAAAGSECAGELVATLPGTYGQRGSPGDWQFCEWVNLCRAVEQSGRFDVVHSHSYLWGLPLERFSRAPMVHTTHVRPGDDGAACRALYPEAWVTAPSEYQWAAYPHLPPVAVVHHGVEPSQFTYQPRPGDYLCYLGRFTPGKGPVAAIHAARAMGLPLVLAGPANAYFHEQVAPHVDGTHVRHIGLVDAPARDRLLGGARALLYPISEPEPFGLVLIEAMMCGTPVAAIGIGAVPEIVEPGITGAWTAVPDDFPDVVRQSLELDRRRVRGRAMERFTAERMTAEYVAVYERACAAAAAARR